MNSSAIIRKMTLLPLLFTLAWLIQACEASSPSFSDVVANAAKSEVDGEDVPDIAFAMASTPALGPLTTVSPLIGDTFVEGSDIYFEWSVSFAELATAEYFELIVLNSLTGGITYNNSAISNGSCTASGHCSHLLQSYGVPLNIGSNSWLVKMLAGSQSYESAQSSFEILADAENQSGATQYAPENDAQVALRAQVDLLLSQKDSWYSQAGSKVTVSGGYFKWPAIAGLTQLHRVTGEKRYLQVAIDLALEHIDVGIDMIGNNYSVGTSWGIDGYLDWKFGSGKGERYNSINVYVYEARAAAGVANALLELDRSGASVIPNDAGQRMEEFLKKHFWEKWTPPSGPAKAAVSNITTLSSHQAAQAAQVALALNQRDLNPGSNIYADWIEKDNFHSVIKNIHSNGGNPSASPFGFMPSPRWDGSVQPSYPILDVSHATDTIWTISLVRKYGLTSGGLLNSELISQMNNHIKTRIWPLAGASDWTENVDGSGNTGGNGDYYNGWTLLAGEDEVLLGDLVNHYLSGANPMPGYETRLHVAAGLYTAIADLNATR